jgi:Polyketide cyclase / dehydrase and lipid transport
MKPVQVSTVIHRPIAEVYAYLDVLAHHEAFTDHFLVDWELHGPPAGIGAAVRMRVKAPGRTEAVELTVIEAQAPMRTVEETVGAGGRRRTRGTYTLVALGSESTEVRFEVAPLEVPLSERPLWPLSRAWLRRQNTRAMQRLREQLEAAPARAAAA